MSSSQSHADIPAPELDLGDVIFSYTRAQAIEDGVLVEVTDSVKRWFKVPVAVTSRVWALVETNEMATVEDLALTILGAIHRQAQESDTVYFDYCGEKMWALIGAGDTTDPVMTVMMLDED